MLERAQGEDVNRILFEALEGGKDIDQRPKLYSSYEKNADEIYRNAFESVKDLSMSDKLMGNEGNTFYTSCRQKA